MKPFKNRKAILDNYNEKIYKETLLRIYSRVIKKPVCQSIDKNILLSEFLNPNNFSLLKWSNYVE
jgi:predicted transglutaminase-like protease